MTESALDRLAAAVNHNPLRSRVTTRRDDVLALIHAERIATHSAHDWKRRALDAEEALGQHRRAVEQLTGASSIALPAWAYPGAVFLAIISAIAGALVRSI